MNPNELEVGDYVEVYFPPTGQSHLAEVIMLDKQAMKAEILPQYERNRISISTPEQWQTIRPHSINSHDLHALGFNETSLEIAYGWTSREWIKISQNRKFVFHLTYEDTSWRFEILWNVGMMYRTRIVEDIHYLHELQHILRQFIIQ